MCPMAMRRPPPFAPPPPRLLDEALPPWPASLEGLRTAAEEAQASVPDYVRALVIQHGVPDGSPAELSSTASSGSAPPPQPATTWRSIAWKVLLLPAPVEGETPPMSAEAYADLVRRAASREAQQISNDSFRTLATDSVFRARVSDAQLVRVLNAYVWKQDLRAPGGAAACGASADAGAAASADARAGAGAGTGQPPVYMQGMNVLCAPFLYALPWELEAFACFSALVEQHCPTYVLPTLAGVHQGVQILDLCLAQADPQLSAHLTATGLNAQLYAFAAVLTLGASQPPLAEVLKLWDFFWARGVHMNLLCVLAQVCALRTQLLATPRPMDCLRSFPPLDARTLIAQALALEHRLTPNLLELIRAHTLQYPLEMPAPAHV